MLIKYIFWNHIVHDKYFQNPPILMGRNRCWYCNDDVSRVEKNICAGCKQVTLQITFSKVGFVHLVKQGLLFPIFLKKESRNGDTLGPVDLIHISYLEWVNHHDFKNIAYVGFFRHFFCVFVFAVVFVIVFVFVFVSPHDFWIAFIISFQNMYGYRGLWGLRAGIMIIFEVMTDTHT